MTKSKDPISKKLTLNEESTTVFDSSLSPEEHDLKELELLKEKIAEMRANEPEWDQLQEEKLRAMSLRALVAHTACNMGANEALIFNMLYKRFGVGDLSEIKLTEQNEARRFLADLGLGEVRKAIN